ELAPVRLRIVLQNVGPSNVGRHQVRRELNTFERQVKDLRQRTDQQRLCQPGNADQETVPPAAQADQQFFDDLFLSNDDLAELLCQSANGIAQLGDHRFFSGSH